MRSFIFVPDSSLAVTASAPAALTAKAAKNLVESPQPLTHTVLRGAPSEQSADAAYNFAGLAGCTMLTDSTRLSYLCGIPVAGTKALSCERSFRHAAKRMLSTAGRRAHWLRYSSRCKEASHRSCRVYGPRYRRSTAWRWLLSCILAAWEPKWHRWAPDGSAVFPSS